MSNITQETQHQATPQADLYRAAEAVARSGRKQEVQFNGTMLTISKAAPRKTRTRRTAADLTPAEREEILRATSGGWKGLIDPAQLKRDLNELQRDESPIRVFRAASELVCAPLDRSFPSPAQRTRGGKE